MQSFDECWFCPSPSPKGQMQFYMSVCRYVAAVGVCGGIIALQRACKNACGITWLANEIPVGHIACRDMEIRCVVDRTKGVVWQIDTIQDFVPIFLLQSLTTF